MDIATIVMILQLVGPATTEGLAIYNSVSSALGTDDMATLDKLLAEADAGADAQHQEAQSL